MTRVVRQGGEEMVRAFADDDGTAWEAIAVEAVVAHGKLGAALGFRPAGDPASEPMRSRVTFNSGEAAAFALRTLGEKELRRRLGLTRAAAAGV
jgi:hypothetical protein